MSQGTVHSTMHTSVYKSVRTRRTKNRLVTIIFSEIYCAIVSYYRCIIVYYTYTIYKCDTRSLTIRNEQNNGRGDESVHGGIRECPYVEMQIQVARGIQFGVLYAADIVHVLVSYCHAQHGQRRVEQVVR